MTILRRPIRDWLFAGLLVLHLVPIALLHYLPTVDGPTHVYNAYVIKQRVLGLDTASREYFSFNPAPVPNWLGHAILSAAMLALSPVNSERVLLAIFVLALPLAFRYFLRAVAQDTQGLEFIIFPFIYSIHFHWGFYNFCLSLILYLVLMGTWLRWTAPVSAARIRVVTLALLFLLAYSASLVSFLQCLFAIGLISLTETALRFKHLSRDYISMAIRTAVAAAPALLVWLYFQKYQVNHGPLPTEYPSVKWAAANLFRFDILNTFGASARMAARLFAVLFWLGTAFEFWRRWRKGQAKLGLPFLATACIGLLIVFIAPTSTGGGTMLTPREVYFVVFGLALWLNSAPIPKAIQFASVSVTSVLALSLLALHWPVYARYDSDMRAFLAGIDAAKLSGHRVLVAGTLGSPFVQEPSLSGYANMSGGLGAYVAAQTGLAYLNNYESQTTHFPLINNYPVMDIHKIRYTMAPNQPVDVLLLWGADKSSEKDVVAKEILHGDFDCQDYLQLPQQPTLCLSRESSARMR